MESSGVAQTPLNLYHPSDGEATSGIISQTSPLNITATKNLMDNVRNILSSLLMPTTDTSLFWGSVIGYNLSYFALSYDGKELKGAQGG